MLSQKVKNLKSSPTLALVAKAKQLEKEGHNVISLTVGEPDWATYKVAADAGINAIVKGHTKYTAAQGQVELRKAIHSRVAEDLNLKYDFQSEIVVTSGAKFAIFAALQVLCDPYDEVIIPSPYWVSYPTMVELAQGHPKIVHCGHSTNYKLTPEMLEKNITNKTKVFLFCSPSNPTGLVYSESELLALADVLRKYPRIVVISDDMYNRLMFGQFKIAPHILQVAPDLSDRTVIINGGSKAYAMTGWRIGWALGPKQIIKAVGDYASQATGAPSTIAQEAAEQALLHTESDIAKTNQMLKSRLDNALQSLSSIQQFTVIKPDGAFYLWINISGILNKIYDGKNINSSAEFCRILLEEYFVSTVPGEEFGQPGYVRLSFAIENEKMNEAIERMKIFISRMK